MAETTEIRLKIDKEFLKELKERVGAKKAAEIIQQALGVYDWATEEIAAGRTVVSANKQGGDIARLNTPEFSRIKRKGTG